MKLQEDSVRSCPNPEVIWDFAVQREKHPQAAALCQHINGCAECLENFVESKKTLTLAAEVKQLQHQVAGKWRQERSRLSFFSFSNAAPALLVTASMILLLVGSCFYGLGILPERNKRLRAEQNALVLTERSQQFIAQIQKLNSEVTGMQNKHGRTQQKLEAADRKYHQLQQQFRTTAQENQELRQKATDLARQQQGLRIQQPAPASRLSIIEQKVAADPQEIQSICAAKNAGTSDPTTSRSLPTLGNMSPRPAATLVSTIRPTFRWNPLPNASYKVVVSPLSQYTEKQRTGSPLHQHEWTPEPAQSLQWGHTYEWKLIVTGNDGKQVETEWIRFGVMKKDKAEALARSGIYAQNLQEGRLYLKAGELQQARHRLEAIPVTAAEWAQAQRLLNQLTSD